MYAKRRCCFFRAKSDLVTVLVCINLTLPLRKSGSVQMALF